LLSRSVQTFSAASLVGPHRMGLTRALAPEVLLSCPVHRFSAAPKARTYLTANFPATCKAPGELNALPPGLKALN
jgi:hypothetical protein